MGTYLAIVLIAAPRFLSILLNALIAMPLFIKALVLFGANLIALPLFVLSAFLTMIVLTTLPLPLAPYLIP